MQAAAGMSQTAGPTWRCVVAAPVNPFHAHPSSPPSSTRHPPYATPQLWQVVTAMRDSIGPATKLISLNPSMTRDAATLCKVGLGLGLGLGPGLGLGLGLGLALALVLALALGLGLGLGLRLRLRLGLQPCCTRRSLHWQRSPAAQLLGCRRVQVLAS